MASDLEFSDASALCVHLEVSVVAHAHALWLDSSSGRVAFPGVHR